MTIERSHGAARPTLPRASDLAELPTERVAHGKRDQRGRFVSGNVLATGRGWKAILRKHVTGALKGETEPLARDAWQLYQCMLRELPCDCASVRQLVAARARAAVLSARYALLAAERGYETAEGVKALEMSVKLDARAERLAVTSLDLSSKLALANRRKGKTLDLTKVIEVASRPRPREGNEQP
jgi:hypothetical protein